MSTIFGLIDAGDAAGIRALTARDASAAAAHDEQGLSAVMRAAYRGGDVFAAVHEAHPPLGPFDRIVVGEIRHRQQVDLDPIRNPTRSAPSNLPGCAQVGDIGDSQPAQCRAALVVEPTQFAGTEQPPGPQHGCAVGHIAKVPRAGQFSENLSHVR